MKRALVALILVAAGWSYGAETVLPKREITAQGYLEATGILGLKLFLPERDTSEPPVTLVWEGPNGESEPSGIDLSELSTGQEVQIYFWLGDWEKAIGSSDVRYVIRYKENRKRSRTKTATLALPKGFQDLSVSLSRHAVPGSLVRSGQLIEWEKPGEKLALCFSGQTEAEGEETSRRSKRLNPVELYEGSGVLGWRIPIYHDLADSEYIAFDWLSAPEEHRDSGFSFEGFPRGREVEVYVFLREWMEGEEKETIRYRSRYENDAGETLLGDGKIRVPPTYTDLYSYLQSGDTLDGGWMLLLSNRFFKKPGEPSTLMSLETVYRFSE